MTKDSSEGRRGDEQGFVSLWPTLFLERSLPGHEAANEALAAYILELEAKARRAGRDLTTDYRSGNFIAAANPAVEWLRQCINKTVIDYLKRLGLDYQIDWQIMGWPNVNRLGDYHDPHNHPHSYLSGTYYLRVPEARPRAESRADVRPGAISFYDPRGAVNMSAIKGDGEIEAEYTLQPKAGTILLWPAYLFHFVHPNLADEPRISISFNIVLKWRPDYLPRQ